jgi:hypothetical protein
MRAFKRLYRRLARELRKVAYLLAHVWWQQMERFWVAVTTCGFKRRVPPFM